MRHFAKAFIGIASMILGSGSALAADLPAPAPVYKAVAPAAAPAFSWTGFYVGANGGYGWKDPTVSYTPNDSNALASTCGGGSCVPSASFNVGGGIVGGQIGYNYQINAMWLVGAETDYDWSRITGNGNSNFILGSVGPVTFVAKETVESFGTFRARLGYIPTAPLLIYATGGLAYGVVRESANLNPGVGGGGSGNTGGGFFYRCNNAASCFTGDSSKTMVGWTIGAGGEFAITSNITVKAEYLYVDLGHGNNINSVAAAVAGAPQPSSFTASFSPVSFNLVRAGLNWKFW